MYFKVVSCLLLLKFVKEFITVPANFRVFYELFMERRRI